MGESKDGPFAVLFCWVGLISGCVAGAEADSGGGPMLVGALILGLTGYAVGKITDKVVAYVIFIATCLIAFLINAAVRRFVFEALQAIFSS